MTQPQLNRFGVSAFHATPGTMIRTTVSYHVIEICNLTNKFG